MGRVLPLFVVLLVASLGVGLGASPKPSGAPPKSSGLPKVGIVSAIGDELHLRKIGLTVFENGAQEMTIDSWHLDELMIAKVRADLSGRFDVRPVTYQRAPFAALVAEKQIFSQDRRSALVHAGVSPQGLDAYLVITKTRGPYGQTKQSLLGLGLVEGGTALFGTQVYAYANYELGMVDGRTWAVSEEAKAFLPPRSLSEIGGVSRKVDKSLWPASPDAAANQRLKAAFADLIDKSLPCALQRMRLIPPVQACDMTVTMPGRD